MTEESSLARRAFVGVRWSLVQKVGGQVISLAVLLVMARILGPADFGLFAIGMVAVNLLGALAGQGFTEALVQRKELERAHVDTAFWAAVGLSLVLAGLLVVARAPLAKAFGDPRLAEIVPALALIQVVRSLGAAPYALLLRDLSLRVMALISLTAAVVGGAVAIYSGLHGAGVWSLVWQHLTLSTTSVVLTWYAVRWWPGLEVSFAHLRELWSFGAYIVGSSLVIQLNRHLAPLLIGLFIGPAAVGLFAVGRRVVQAVTMGLTAAVGQVALPTFSRMQDDRSRMARAFTSVVQLVSLVTFPVFLLLAAQAEQLILILLGEKWVGGSGVLMFLALGAMVGSVQWFNGTVMVASGRPGWRLLLQMANTLGTVVAFFLTYPFGITAVAAGFTIRGYLSFPLGLLLLRRLLPVRLGEYYRKLTPAFAAGLAGASVALVAGFLFRDLNLVFRSLLGTLSGLACYAALLYLFAPRLIERFLEYARLISGTRGRQ